ncbi:MAG: hypothetical protein LBC88_05120 [Spirochaetaceae bacterium]|jgi:ABC-type sugar transport system permease subunit|nr:hypothetical protein [Spirochaetaceae bacterium]
MTIIPHKRLVCLVLTAFLTLAAVFAEIFVFTRHDHEHTGEQCTICLEIQIVRQVLEGAGRAGAAGAAAVLAVRAALRAKRARSLCFIPATPVLLKTRLNF